MKQHYLKQQIKSQIAMFFDQFRPGDMFRSDDLVKHCKRHMGLKYIYPDTIIRYARLLRKEGRINYTVTIKSERIIKVIGLGEVHSR